METLLKLLPFITVAIGLLTALLNLKINLLKYHKNKAMSETSFALIAIVVVCLIVIAAICYLVKK
ncbi:hypothetical protein [Mucilaginibacter psychrotolerans]|uniref:Uncharacterized protein n=1 Tax=Mucilaginibacter psychrotolerans TaxID=1524096 RepID=A0A4Y8S3A3_9SPHI|nr:hypothetical protein [Mucilaginibacter psychrotolerans]TFF33469.1 hypothetical protein E2R66_25635 [Mucilaginibacter psychrotolerans]